MRVPRVTGRVAPHVVMAAAMAYAMVNGHSVSRSLAAAAVLLLLSFVYAKAARSSPIARDTVIDLWAMGLVLIVGHASASSGGAHSHGTAGLTAQFLVPIVAVAWLAARALNGGRRATRHRLVTGCACALGLAMMVAMA